MWCYIFLMQVWVYYLIKLNQRTNGSLLNDYSGYNPTLNTTFGLFLPKFPDMSRNEACQPCILE